MRVSVYLPFVMSLLLAVGGPLLARWLAPRTAARALVIAAAVTSASALWALGLLALSLLLDTGPPALSTLADSAPWLAALPALALAATALTRVLLVARERHHALASSREFSRGHQASDGGLVVIADEQPFAATLPGRAGRIVVSSAMLASLGVRERRALLCHERCHLVNRHDRYRLVGDIACAANPLLGAVRASITHALERWADEDAATTVGSRPLVARALAQAALAPAAAPRGALAFSAHGVSARVNALHRRPARTRRSAALLVLSVAMLAAAASADATLAIERLLHLVTIGHL